MKKFKFNPIRLVDKNGKVMTFENIQQFYIQVLQLLYKDYCYDHIDYLRFLADHTDMNGYELIKNSLGFCWDWLGMPLNIGDESDYNVIGICGWNHKLPTLLITSHLILALCLNNDENGGYTFDEFKAAFDIFWQDIKGTC